MVTAHNTTTYQRTQYSKEFKDMVLRDIFTSGDTTRAIAERHGLKVCTVRNWKYAENLKMRQEQQQAEQPSEKAQAVECVSIPHQPTEQTATTGINATEYFKLVEENKHLRALLKLYMK